MLRFTFHESRRSDVGLSDRERNFRGDRSSGVQLRRLNQIRQETSQITLGIDENMKYSTANLKNSDYDAQHVIYVGTQTGSLKSKILRLRFPHVL